MTSNKKINSHKIQRALIGDLLGDKVFLLKDNKVEKRNIDKVFSDSNLFNLDKEKTKELEVEMNQSFENDVINIFRKIKASDKSLKMTYADNIKIRGYIYMTFLRLNNMHMDFDDEIKKLMNLEYNDRFVYHGNNPLKNFFLNETHIKIIKHKDHPFFVEENFMLTFPFDTQHTDFMLIKRLVGTFPGFVFPISKNHSIVMTNNFLTNYILSNAMQKKSVDIRFNFSVESAKYFLVPHAKRILEDGTAEDLFDFKTYKTNSERDEMSRRSVKRTKSFNKDKTFYEFDILDMNDEDFDILIVDNISKYFGRFDYNENMSIIFGDDDTFLNYIDDLIKVEREVEFSNKPLDYWAKKENIRKHKIWELLNSKTIMNITKIRKILIDNMNK